MKPNWRTRPFGAAAAAAAALAAIAMAPWAAASRDTISNQLAMGMGICRKSALGLELDVCLRDGERGNSSSSKGQAKGASGGSAAFESDVWAHTTPCYQNQTDNTEFCVFTSTSFASNHGITILTAPQRAEHFAKKPAFTQPESVRGTNRDSVAEAEQEGGRARHLPPLSYRVEEMPGKGYGVVATKFLNRGDLIMSNTASVIIDYAVFASAPEKAVNALQAAGIDHLPELHRARFLNLSAHSESQGYDERVAQILATNAFDIEADDGEEYGFFVVFPEISRLNHDCRPNADYHFDFDTLTHHVHAVRPIAAGEEITVSYMDLVQTRKQRMDKLKSTWGFTCSCSLCSQGRALAKASDERIAQIRELRPEFQDYSTNSRATPEMAELFVSLYQQERLDALLYEAYSYAAIEWNGVGEPWTASRYARLALEHGLMSVGPRDGDVDEMRRLASDPWTHWSWLLRKSRRLQWGKKDTAASSKKTPSKAAARNSTSSSSSSGSGSQSQEKVKL